MAEPLVPEFVHVARAKQLEAEAEKFLQEARSARYEADMEEMLLKEKKRVHDEVFAHNKFNNVYVFGGSVDEKSVRACMDQLDVWRRLEPNCAVELIFTSPGGSVIDGLALWDYLQAIRAEGVKLTTVARGYAASMAGILLQAGENRVMGRESYLLIHQISGGVMGSFGDIEDRVKWIEMVQNRILDIFAERSLCNRQYIKKNWERKDWWISSEEALKLGFVDEVR